MTPSERPSFNLSRDPWIACETADGARVELGLEEVLLRAHELASVADESPLATAMIYRLLLAILHRVVKGPKSLSEWGQLWRSPAIEPALIRQYFDRWRHRFDLFDATRPFLQVPNLKDVLARERGGKNTEVLPARRLALERSFHSGATHLFEHGEDLTGISPAQAARAMLGFQGFGPGGRIFNDSGYPKQCPLRAGAVVIARGATVRHTLMLNLLVPSPGMPPETPDDAPAWEQEQPAERATRAVRGWLDALTWQARRVELLPEVDNGKVVIRQVITAAAEEPEGDWIEPMFAWVVRDPKRGREAIRIDPDRHLWRDATALFQASDPQGDHRRPVVCSQIAALVEEDVLDRADLFMLEVYGLASSQAVIEIWRAERMPLPARLLSDTERVEVVTTALRFATDVMTALRKSASDLARHMLSPGKRDPDKKDVRSLVDRFNVAGRYWSELGGLVDRFLRDVGESNDPEAVLAAWKRSAKRAARRSLDAAAEQAGTQARAFQARAHAERSLLIALAALSDAPVTPTPAQGDSR